MTGGVAGGDGAKGDTVGFRDDDDAAASATEVKVNIDGATDTDRIGDSGRA